MPFAEGGGAVSLSAEHAGEGGPPVFDQWRVIGYEDVALQPCPPGVAAGEEAVAGGGAHGAGRMGVGEGDAGRGDTVDVRRPDLARGVHGMYITIA